jgi:hypothetical protein
LNFGGKLLTSGSPLLVVHAHVITSGDVTAPPQIRLELCPYTTFVACAIYIIYCIHYSLPIKSWKNYIQKCKLEPPTEKNLPINPKNQSEAASYFLSNEFGKTEPMKTFDSSNQSEKHPALVFFNFKIHHFYNNCRSERTYCWLFIFYVINLDIYHSLFEGKFSNIFFYY